MFSEAISPALFIFYYLFGTHRQIYYQARQLKKIRGRISKAIRQTPRPMEQIQKESWKIRETNKDPKQNISHEMLCSFGPEPGFANDWP